MRITKILETVRLRSLTSRHSKLATQNMSVVVRFAPSPTGPLHIGGVRTALYNYLFARQQGGKFLLRIEDTDQTRFVPGAEQYIIDSLTWCGITFDAGVHINNGDGVLYRQSDRMKAGMYRQYAEQLVAEGKAYIAFDTAEQLDAARKEVEAAGGAFSYNYVTRMRMTNSLTLSEAETKARMDAGEPYVIRFLMPRKEEVRFRDLIRDWVVFHSSQLDDKVLLKSDGMPTYHLANVVDDHLMDVTHVIRGEEWLPSTPLHVLLYRAFGWEHPEFSHLPLLLKPVGEGKLSKRDGDKMGFPVFPMQWHDPFSNEISSGFRDSGYLPDALVNFLALLGWNPGNDEEVMSMERMTELFSLEKVSKSGAKFNIEKLKSLNEIYLRAKSNEEIVPMVKPAIEAAGYAMPSDEYLAAVIGLMKERITFAREVVEKAPYFFAPIAEFDPKMLQKWTAQAKEALEGFVPMLEAAADWKHEPLHDAFQAYAQEKGLNAGKIMPALRCALAGVAGGPGVWEMAEVLGKNETVARLRSAVATLPVS